MHLCWQFDKFVQKLLYPGIETYKSEPKRSIRVFEPALLDYLNYVEREEALARAAGGDGGLTEAVRRKDAAHPYQLLGKTRFLQI